VEVCAFAEEDFILCTSPGWCSML